MVWSWSERLSSLVVIKFRARRVAGRDGGEEVETEELVAWRTWVPVGSRTVMVRFFQWIRGSAVSSQDIPRMAS